MSLLAQADAKYRMAGCLDLDRFAVHDATVDGCCAAATAFIRRIDSRDRPAVWAASRNAAAALRWSLLTRPLKAGSRQTDAQAALGELRAAARDLMGKVDAVVHQELSHLVAAGLALGTATDELAEQIVACACGSAAEKTCVVLVGTAARDATQSSLAARLPGVAFLSPRQFLGGRTLWDKAVVVGISAWYPDELFTAPRCGELILVHHRWLRDRRKVTGLFAGGGDDGLQVTLPTQNEARVHSEEIRPPVESVDWSGIEPVGGIPQDSDPSDDVPAHLVVLAGGYGFYLDHEADTIRGLDPACTGERWIRQMPATELGPDSVVVLRKGVSEREILRPLISEILGDEEAAVRERQAHWKGILAERLRSGGLRSIGKTVGRPDLTYQYARYWAGPNCISPRQPAFSKLLEYLEVPDVSGCLDAAKQLYAAHHMAGRQLSKELENLVDGAVVQRLHAEDLVTLSYVSGGRSARITLFKVLAISPKLTTVPASALRTALKLKGTRWLG
jgi:hypothetical protein